MGILRTNEISGLETPTPVTGSVVFDGTGDYLQLSDSGDWDFGTGDFTIESWVYLTADNVNYGLASTAVFNASGWTFELNGGLQGGYFGFMPAPYQNRVESPANSYEANTWTHLAITRQSGTLYMFSNGNLVSTTTGFTYDITNGQVLTVGQYGPGWDARYYFDGYISNFRILKGTALYTSDFTPPVHELQRIGDTVLLCCNNPDSAGAEATGKTITVNGDAAASTFSPGLTRDFTSGTQFQGVAKFDTQGYFVPPSGTTEQRGRGRGIQGGGYVATPGQTYVNSIFYYEISSTGNAVDFGDLLNTPGHAGTVGSTTRGVFAGQSQPAVANTIQFVTISTTGNAVNFGDMTDTKWASGGAGSSTRGLFAGGRQPSYQATIDYITIAALGDAADFGDLTAPNHEMAAASSPTRAVFAGGSAPGSSPTITNKIDFVTIATLGNATNFGDLLATRKNMGGVASQTRMCIGGGLNPSLEQSIEYLTIATTGNTQTFGDLTGSEGRWGCGGTSNSARGVFGGGYDPSPATISLNTMDYITIASTGDAKDFGDIGTSSGANIAQGLSDSHGGLS